MVISYLLWITNMAYCRVSFKHCSEAGLATYLCCRIANFFSHVLWTRSISLFNLWKEHICLEQNMFRYIFTWQVCILCEPYEDYTNSFNAVHPLHVPHARHCHIKLSTHISQYICLLGNFCKEFVFTSLWVLQFFDLFVFLLLRCPFLVTIATEIITKTK